MEPALANSLLELSNDPDTLKWRIEAIAQELDPAHEQSILVSILANFKLTQMQIADVINEYSLWLYDSKPFFAKTWGADRGNLILASYGQRILTKAFEALVKGEKVLARPRGEFEAHPVFPNVNPKQPLKLARD